LGEDIPRIFRCYRPKYLDRDRSARRYARMSGSVKRSRSIQLTIVTSLASALISCEQRVTRYCVDQNQRVVDDKLCEQSQPNPGLPYYRWYYGGARGSVPLGTHLSGGSYFAPARGFVTPAEADNGTVRGIFGRAGAAASGGHGEAAAGE
jgi:hypothetical protein